MATYTVRETKTYVASDGDSRFFKQNDIIDLTLAVKFNMDGASLPVVADISNPALKSLIDANTSSIIAEAARMQRGLKDPNPGATRLFATPTVMTSPPTITPGTSNQASQIANSVLVPHSNSDFTYFGCPSGVSGNFTSPSNIANWNGTTALYGSYAFAVEFETDAPVFELYVKGNGPTAKYRIMVDNLDGLGPRYDVRAGRGDTLADGASWRIKYDFTTRANRRIRFDFDPNVNFGGIYRGPNDTIWKSSRPRQPRVAMIHDSWVGGSANVAGKNTYGEMLGWLLGWDVYKAGAGGTGLIADNTGTRTPYQTRLQKDIIAPGADIWVLCGSINDSASSSAAVLAAARLAISTLQAGLPNAKGLVIGVPWPTGSPSLAVVGIRDSVRQAADEAGLTHLEQIGGPYPSSGASANYVNSGIITGTGKVGSTTGSGNADIYIDTDGSHATQIGNDYRAYRIASQIAALMPL